MKANNKYMTVEEVAEYLNLSKVRIHIMARNKEIPCHQPTPAGKYYFDKDEIDGWVKRNDNNNDNNETNNKSDS